MAITYHTRGGKKMRRSAGAFVVGILFVLLGVAIGLSAFGIHLNFYFDGWWTLFIIIPCFVGLFEKKNRFSSLIGLMIGILLLLSAQNLFSWWLSSRLLAAILCCLIGVRLLFRRKEEPVSAREEEVVVEVVDEERQEDKTQAQDQVYRVLFSGRKIQFTRAPKKTVKLSATFGCLEVDLRQICLEQDLYIEANCLFAGMDLYLPKNATVVSQVSSAFGGVEQKATDVSAQPYKIYLSGSCIFGGIELY